MSWVSPIPPPLPVSNFSCCGRPLLVRFVREPSGPKPLNRTVYADLHVSDLPASREAIALIRETCSESGWTLHSLGLKVLPFPDDMCIFTQSWIANVSRVVPVGRRDFRHDDLVFDRKHQGFRASFRFHLVKAERALGLRSHQRLTSAQQEFVSRRLHAEKSPASLLPSGVAAVASATIVSSGDVGLGSGEATGALSASVSTIVGDGVPVAVGAVSANPTLLVAAVVAGVNSIGVPSTVAAPGAARPMSPDSELTSRVNSLQPLTPRPNLFKPTSFVQTPSVSKRDRSPGDAQVIGGKYARLVVEGDQGPDELLVDDRTSEPPSATSVPLASASGPVDPGGGGVPLI